MRKIRKSPTLDAEATLHAEIARLRAQLGKAEDKLVAVRRDAEAEIYRLRRGASEQEQDIRYYVDHRPIRDSGDSVYRHGPHILISVELHNATTPYVVEGRVALRDVSPSGNPSIEEVAGAAQRLAPRLVFQLQDQLARRGLRPFNYQRTGRLDRARELTGMSSSEFLTHARAAVQESIGNRISEQMAQHLMQPVPNFDPSYRGDRTALQVRSIDGRVHMVNLMDAADRSDNEQSNNTREANNGNTEESGD